MGQEVKKGNKVPYHGLLLTMTEWKKYKAMQELVPEMIQYFEEVSMERQRWEQCLK